MDHRNPPKHQRLHPRLPPPRLPRPPLRTPQRNPRSHAHVTCASSRGKKPEEIAKEVSSRNSCAKARLLRPSPDAGSKNASSLRKHVLRSRSLTSTTSKNINSPNKFKVLEILNFLLLTFSCSTAEICCQPRICLFVSIKQSSL